MAFWYSTGYIWSVVGAVMMQSLKNIYHFLTAWFFVIWYGIPSRNIKIIGVTGTDGKTTTCHLIYEILKKAGIKVALISTVAAYLGEEELDTGFHVTSPDARILQPLLLRIKKEGFTHLVLEVTSHGLDQNRFAGMKFYTAIITNITHEHLDYHKTFEKYKATKMKLLKMARYPIYEYTKTKIKIENPALAGEHNKYNIGAAEAVAKIFGIQYSVIGEVVKEFSGVPGRMEEIKWPKSCLPAGRFRAIVDFAHTPNALLQVLKELKNQKPKNSKLILIFGCAGLRDHSKRPMMGEIAMRFADKVIITAEDPRTESLDDIYRQITSPPPSPESNSSRFASKRGGSTAVEGEVFRIDDRTKAIQMAVDMAEPGDIVVATGKGHERSMCFGKKEYPWSDREAFEKAIKQ